MFNQEFSTYFVLPLLVIVWLWQLDHPSHKPHKNTIFKHPSADWLYWGVQRLFNHDILITNPCPRKSSNTYVQIFCILGKHSRITQRLLFWILLACLPREVACPWCESLGKCDRSRWVSVTERAVDSLCPMKFRGPDMWLMPTQD